MFMHFAECRGLLQDLAAFCRHKIPKHTLVYGKYVDISCTPIEHGCVSPTKQKTAKCSPEPNTKLNNTLSLHA